MNKFKKVQRILIVILVLNWIVALSKVIYGLLTKCASMTADGVHSFSDGASNIIGLVGIWAASKPKDDTHPYGHKKFETFATLGIGVILFLASFDILKDALLRLFNPVLPDVTIGSFIIMLVTIAINIMVTKYERREGLRLNSDILTSDALHTRSDIFASLAVLVSLLSIKMGYPVLDVIIAIIIAVLIAKAGVQILKAGSDVLCDANVLVNTKVCDIVKNVKGVKSVHHIRTRGRQDDIHVDLHVIIPASMHIDIAHELSHKIENTLKKEISGVTEVSVHLEPHNDK